MEPLNPPVPIEELIPHRGTLLMLEKVLAHGPEGVRCAAVVPSSGPLVEEGGMRPWVCVELMAQAAAADRGLRVRRRGEEVGPGLLLAAKDVRFERPLLERGRRLEVLAKLAAEDGPMSAFDCEIRDAQSGEVLAAGSLRVSGD